MNNNKIFILTNKDWSYSQIVIGYNLDFIADTIIIDKLRLNEMICVELKLNAKKIKKYSKIEHLRKSIDEIDFQKYLKQFFPEILIDGNSTKLQKIVRYEYEEMIPEINECIVFKRFIPINKIKDLVSIKSEIAKEKNAELTKLLEENAKLAKDLQDIINYNNRQL